MLLRFLPVLNSPDRLKNKQRSDDQGAEPTRAPKIGLPDVGALWAGETGFEIIADDLILRPARAGDYGAWARLRADSREHLTRWEPDWRAEDATREAFVRRMRADHAHFRAGRRMPLLVFRKRTLVGGVSLSDIRHGNRRSAVLGYWIGVAHTRQGIGRRSVDAMAEYAFQRLDLQRLEAACQPENEPSRRLLRACGFACEGIARDYLKIAGTWRDHEIWARTRSTG